MIPINYDSRPTTVMLSEGRPTKEEGRSRNIHEMYPTQHRSKAFSQKSLRLTASDRRTDSTIVLWSKF
jgi:hypothetical protein